MCATHAHERPDTMTGTTRSSSTRVMIYSQDGLGLGHLRRTSAIASRLAELVPDVAILTCMDSPMGPFFDPGERHDHLKLPCIVKVGPGQWRANALPVDFADIHALRSRLLVAAAEGFAPDLLLVDHMPHGAQGELLATLRYLRAERPGTQIVLGLRDILDDPAVIDRVWTAEGAMDALAEHYDQMLVYGARNVFDAGQRYGFDAIMDDRINHVGFVGKDGRDRPPKDREGNRALIFAMVGGGADGYPLMRALVDAYPFVNAARPSRLVITTGPFMPAELRDDLERRARNQHVKIRSSVKDTWRYLRSADTVVAMAGYNSCVEILRSGTPSILVPRKGPSAEQTMRANLFGNLGWVRTIHPDDLTPASMTEQLLASLAGKRKRQRPGAAVLDGRDNAARALADMLDPERVSRHGARRLASLAG